MAYQVIARQYRPKDFDEVIGQQAVAKILKNAIQAGRVAHAYLFAGPRGVGKTTMARIFAKGLCCKNGPTPTPCNKCDACISIQDGDDIDAIEIDGASNNGVDEVRQLRENAAYVPARSAYKLYIIDEAHMLSKPAFNALLKILEEPPPHIKFILVTTEPQKIIETVRSRCQRLDFRRISTADMVDALGKICKKEKIKISKAALEAIVRNSRGGLRDSQSLLEQLRAFCQDDITEDDVNSVLGAVSSEQVFELLDAIARRDASEALLNLDKAISDGVDVDQYLTQTGEHLRRLMLVKVCSSNSPILDETAEAQKRLTSQAGLFELNTILYASQLVADTRIRVRKTPHSRIEAEILIVKLCRLEDLSPLDEMMQRMEEMERRLSGGAPPPIAARPSQRAARGSSSKQYPSAQGAGPEASSSVREETPPVEEAPPTPINGEPGECWPSIVLAIRKKGGPIGGLLQQGHLLGAEDGVIRLGFAPKGASKVAGTRVADKSKELEDSIERLVGSRWKLEIETLSDELAAQLAAKAPQEPGEEEDETGPEGGTFTEQLAKTFTGTVQNSER